MGNPNKDKWIYALSVTPLNKMKIAELLQKTTDETECPFAIDELESRGKCLQLLFFVVYTFLYIS